MPEYDAENFEPPAPVAYVTLRNPATGVLLSDVPMLIDTGADITLLPSNARLIKSATQASVSKHTRFVTGIQRPSWQVADDQCCFLAGWRLISG